MKALIPENEAERLQALRDSQILDTDAEAEFDDFTLLAAQICGTPISLISLVDADRQWFKSHLGLDVSETPREQAFCAHALHRPDVFLVPNAAEDARFSDNPLVTGDPNIRFYAGAPLRTADGHALGTLCVLDRVPRSLTPAQQDALQALSRQVVARLELRRQLREREKANRAREESESLKNAILESALDGIITIDEQGRVVEWNPAAERTFGCLREDALGCDLSELIIPPHFREAHRRGMAHFLDTGEGPVLHRRVEVSALRADGTEFPVELAISPLQIEGRTLFTATLRDISERRRAEDALKTIQEELEARVQQRTLELSAALAEHRNVMETVPDVLFRLDTEGRLVQWNRRMETVTGLPGEVLDGLPAVELFAPGEQPAIVAALGAAFTTGYAVVEASLLGRGGGAVLHQFSGVPLHGPGGEVIGLTGMGRDITEQRRTEQALRESEARYERIAANLPGMVFQCLLRPDLSLTFTYVSEGCREIYGLEPEEILADANLIAGIIHPEDLAEFTASLTAIAADLVPWRWEGRIVTRNGEVKWLCGEARVERLPNGDVVSEGQVQDVTERRNAQEAMRESETRYRGLVEHSPEAVVVYSENRLVYVNAAAVRLFGASCAEDLIGRRIFDFVHPDFHALSRARAAHSLGEGRHSPLAQQKYVRLDGRVIDVEVVSTGIVYGGQPAGQVLIRDITERKRAEESILALHAELLHAYDATIEGWSRALDLRDHETEGHSRRVTEMTLRLARVVGIPEAEMVHVRRGALLHDIGKMGVPDAVLLKPGPLSDAEWVTMRRHPALAKALLDPAEFLRPALTIPYCHHEKWDGSGYPQGLRGGEIPLPARLFALVDVWDALSSDRPYRPAWPPERVKDHLHRLAGTHFDPDLVSVFLSLLDDGSSEAERPGLRAA